MSKQRLSICGSSGTAFLQVLTAVERHIDWDTVKCLVIAGPGFVKDDFKKYMDEEAVRRDLRCKIGPLAFLK